MLFKMYDVMHCTCVQVLPCWQLVSALTKEAKLPQVTGSQAIHTVRDHIMADPLLPELPELPEFPEFPELPELPELLSAVQQFQLSTHHIHITARKMRTPSALCSSGSAQAFLRLVRWVKIHLLLAGFAQCADTCSGC